VTAASGNLHLLVSLSRAAEAAGLRPGQTLRDARAVCPGLVTHPRNPQAEAALLTALGRWAGRFSPWVATEAPDALLVDLTGCAHLFGGEAALVAQVEADCAALGISVAAGLADTVGAAWALARYAGAGAAPPGAGGSGLSGDAIDQEARATRSRAARRSPGPAARPSAGGPARPPLGAPTGPTTGPTTGPATGPATGGGSGFPPAPPGLPAERRDGRRIAAPGRTHAALDPLPVAALRLDPADVAALTRLGLRRIGDLAGQPRAGLARRFGQNLVRRLDQAFGVEPEPVSPMRPAPRFAVRLSLPDPIGLAEDVLAAIDRLLPELAARLERAGQGARLVRLEALRCDGRTATLEAGLARPSAEPARIRPLLVLKLDALDAGPGIDALRLTAPLTEPAEARTHKGHLDAAGAVSARLAAGSGLDDLVGRLGARVGLEAITRLHPADSHIPEKTATVQPAAWSRPAGSWPRPPTPRPGLIWLPEPLAAADGGALSGRAPPGLFRWRRRLHHRAAAIGPERIAPEWWLDDPRWRSGVRDYWQVTTEAGERLWLYHAHGGQLSAGWFCQGSFD
jgi:protein ImuB